MNRVVQMWNKLPDDVVQASTISVFKARLDSYWLEIGYGHCERPMALLLCFIYIIVHNLIINQSF